MVEMSNGCICCTLREDLLIEVSKLAKEGKFDYLVIESTGISEPLPVAETFTFEDEDGESLSEVAKLDTMVTVIDGVNFLSDFNQSKSLQEAGESLGEEDERSVTDLLIDQVEFADVLLISKTDLLKEHQIDELTAILRSLNREAEILPISNGNVPLHKVLNTDKFDFDKAKEAPGWLQEIRGEHVPETEEYGIGSFTFTARLPFNPIKLHRFLTLPLSTGKLIRSKGFFWIASQPQRALIWSQAGGIYHHQSGGYFWKAIPKHHWPKDRESMEFIKSKWQEPFGDMRQELVFIGQGLDKEAMISELESCLLTKEELKAGMEYWMQIDDPFDTSKEYD